MWDPSGRSLHHLATGQLGKHAPPPPKLASPPQLFWPDDNNEKDKEKDTHTFFPNYWLIYQQKKSFILCHSLIPFRTPYYFTECAKSLTGDHWISKMLFPPTLNIASIQWRRLTRRVHCFMVRVLGFFFVFGKGVLTLLKTFFKISISQNLKKILKKVKFRVDPDLNFRISQVYSSRTFEIYKKSVLYLKKLNFSGSVLGEKVCFIVLITFTFDFYRFL